MLKFFGKNKGSVSLLLLVIMLPMLVFSFTVVDLCKILMAEDVISSSADLAVNSALTTYDDVLKDMYGMLATSATEEELTAKMNDYYRLTLSASGVDLSEDDEQYVQNFLSSLFSTGIDADSLNNNHGILNIGAEPVDGNNAIKAVTVPSSSMANPAVLRRQIVEYSKYRGPIHMATGIMEKIGILSDLGNQTKATEKKLEFEEKLSDLASQAKTCYTLFRIYYSNQSVMEGGSATFTELYGGDAAEYDLKKRYLIKLPPGSSHAVTQSASASASGDYIVNKTLSYGSGITLSFTAAAVIAPFINDSLMLRTYSVPAYTYTADETDAKISELVSLLNKYDTSGENYAALHDVTAAANGLTSFSALTDYLYQTGGSKASAQNILDIMNAYLPLYNGSVSSAGMKYGSFAEHYRKFMSCYNEAAEQAESSEDPDLLAAVAGAEALHDDLEKLSANVDTWINSLRIAVADKFNGNIQGLTQGYYQVYQQYAIAKRLCETDLTALFDSYSSARDAAKSYSDSVDKIGTEGVKSSMKSACESETSALKELSRNDLNALIAELKKQRDVYKSVLDWMNGYALYSDKLLRKLDVDRQPESDETSNGYEYTLLDVYPKIKSAISYEVGNIDSFLLSSLNVTVPSGAPGAVNGGNWPSRWTSFEPEITAMNNNLYIQMEKDATPPREEKDKDESVKNKTNELGKVDENGNADITKDSGNSSGSSGGSGQKTQVDLGALNSNTFDKYYQGLIDSGKVSDDSAETQEADDSSLGYDSSNNKGTGSSDKDTASNAKSSLSGMSGMLEKLSDFGEAARDKFLITEYLTSMFSCHTTNVGSDGKNITETAKKEAMLSGAAFIESTTLYRGELEYILYGLDSTEKNVAAAGAIIFGLRFVLNLIYSFTDSEIRAVTLAAATAAGGLLPFSVPLIQTVIHIGLAVAESAIDLTQLLSGKDVPIYKSKNTWVCSPSGLARGGAEIVADAAGKLVDSAVDGLAGELTGLIDEATGEINKQAADYEQKINKMVNQKRDLIKQSIETSIKNPFKEKLQEILLSPVEETGTEKITEKLIQVRDTLKNDLGLDDPNTDDPLKWAEYKIITALDDGVLHTVGEAIHGKLDDLTEKITGISITDYADGVEALQSKVNEVFKKLDEVIDGVADDVNELTGKIRSKVEEYLDDISKDVKDGIVKGADGIKDAFKEEMKSLTNTSSNAKLDAGKPGKSKTGLADNITLNYKEYLYIFTFIGVCVNEHNMLQRAALVMQTNCKEKSGKDYNINETSTFIGAQVKGSVKTVFYGAVFKDGKLDFSGKPDRYLFTKISYMGY